MTYIAYSDGACKGNGQVENAPGGWGMVVVCPNGQKIERCGGKFGTTNNQMELQASIEALNATPAGAKVELTTDSQYVIKGITEWISGWKKRNWVSSTGDAVKNQDLWKALDTAVSTRHVKWHWVRGHTGHPENERCDELANEGIAQLPGGAAILAELSSKKRSVVRKVTKKAAPATNAAVVLAVAPTAPPILGDSEMLFEL